MARGDGSWRQTYWGNPCQQAMTTVTVGRASVKVDTRAVGAFVVLDRLFALHRYDVHPEYPEGDTATYNCRKVGGSNVWSSHAWAIAIDVNWQSNPQGKPLRTDLPTGLIAAVRALRTNAGSPVFRWGGDFSNPDPMHFEVISTPNELATGIKDYGEEGEMDTFKKGDNGWGVAALQEALSAWARSTGKFNGVSPNPNGSLWERWLHYGIDADFGTTTEEAVKAYQGAAQHTVSGVVGGATAFLLARYSEGKVGPPAHNHDGRYARTHNHPYAPADHGPHGSVEHNHDGVYAAADHGPHIQAKHDHEFSGRTSET